MIKIRNLNSIQVFNAVSQLKNITHAAHSLNISQSSASYHIKKLEAELKISLFDRRPEGLKMTDNGKLLAAHVENGLRSIQTGLDQASDQTEIVRIAILLSLIHI